MTPSLFPQKAKISTTNTAVVQIFYSLKEIRRICEQLLMLKSGNGMKKI